jgi:hypothetical protein
MTMVFTAEQSLAALAKIEHPRLFAHGLWGAITVGPLSADDVVTAITARDDAIRAKERERCANKARDFAAHYSAGTDGRNTFIILAEWIESGARAQPAERAKETGDDD